MRKSLAAILLGVAVSLAAAVGQPVEGSSSPSSESRGGSQVDNIRHRCRHDAGLKHNRIYRGKDK